MSLLAAVLVAALMYAGLLRIPAKHLFRVTGWMIALLAAGMASQAAFFLQQAEMVPVLGEVAWDSSNILASGSVLGKVLHTLIGYTDQPTELQVVVYAATLLVIYALMRRYGSTSPKKEKAVVV